MAEFNEIWLYPEAGRVLFEVSLFAAWLSGLAFIVGSELRRRQACRRRRAIFRE
ncbi:MAG TPA: hypothetical protein VGR91_14225 [Stellaceae bacterium]|nr:hypothetical protein [Stellaceae bacterium]